MIIRLKKIIFNKTLELGEKKVLFKEMSFFTYPTIGGPSFNPNAKPNPNDNWQGVPYATPFQQYKIMTK